VLITNEMHHNRTLENALTWCINIVCINIYLCIYKKSNWGLMKWIESLSHVNKPSYKYHNPPKIYMYNVNLLGWINRGKWRQIEYWISLSHYYQYFCLSLSLSISLVSILIFNLIDKLITIRNSCYIN
jgi:hypothetical protein